jgi:F0F1-type ATP synthase delta subunit
MHHDYVQAVIAVLATGAKPETVLTNLKSVLDRRGHVRLLPRIMRALERELARLQTVGVPTLTVARASDATSALAKSLVRELALDDAALRIVVDETIVGGAKLRANSQEIDASYKTALITLYQSITK